MEEDKIAAFLAAGGFDLIALRCEMSGLGHRA